MLGVIGFIVLLGSIFGGYVASNGQMLHLWHPFEILIIFGGATGAVIIANPGSVLKNILRHLKYVFAGNGFNRAYFEELMHLLCALFNMARKQGGKKALEEHIEKPEHSSLFTKYPKVLATQSVTEFLTGNLRLMLEDSIHTHELEALIEEEMHNYEKEISRSAEALTSMGDALPGFGIMAAVLGIVITMGSLGGPAQELGMKIGAALVGTFMGVFLGYGVVGPMAGAIGHSIHAEIKALELIKNALSSHHGGTPPEVSVETGRKILFSEDRPTFEEMEQMLSESRE
ncbi:flagellar motor stator protein MotA [Endozoicomonas sp. Mp262]|uniref:flagellar motor stator protein MotA n=1 Tax=Endozoicomonas sp. Mp262 TaxID=2919499 RepID=UPI0021D92145